MSISLNDVDIVHIDPPLCSENSIYMLESFTVNALIRSSLPVHLLRPQLWTNAVHKHNPQGNWHGLEMSFSRKENGVAHFNVTLLATSHGDFEYTIRIAINKVIPIRKKLHGNGVSSSPSVGIHSSHTSMTTLISKPTPAISNPTSNPPVATVPNTMAMATASITTNNLTTSNNITLSNSSNSTVMNALDDAIEWKWAGNYGMNGRLHVNPPSDSMPWTKGPQYSEIMKNLYIGNFIAATQADSLGFKALLNLAKELDINPPPSVGHYKKISLEDGAQQVIDESVLKEAILWIENKLIHGNAKTLLFCRAGLGRSGSIAIAYLFYSHPEWNYTQTLEAIWKIKSDIFPHKDLQMVLERLYPRKPSH